MDECELDTLLMTDYLAWAENAFPESTALSCARHLEKEVKELLYELEFPFAKTDKAKVDEEICDCLMLILHAAYRAKTDLNKELRRKLEINRTRKWVLNEDGFREHDRG